MLALFIVRFDHLHGHMTSDHDLQGVQKFHDAPVPRVGGIAILVAMLAAFFVLLLKQHAIAAQYGLLILSAAPAFIGGFVEDLTKKVSVLHRLLLTMLAALCGFWLLGAGLNRVDIPIIDSALNYWPVAMALTAFAVAGVANAVNIIDGYNGLAGVVSIFIFAALGYVSYLLGDHLLWTTSIAMIGAILGFLVWNYPNGLIFLGDGGAYLIGFMIGEVSVLLVARHPEVSAWFPFLLVIYPIFETIFSIYRKKIIRKSSPGMPDGVHLHMLIYKRLVRWAFGSKEISHRTRRNSLTSPYLWILSSIAAIPAVLFWNNKIALIISTAAFIICYLWLYRAIVTFKTPAWLIIKNNLNKNVTHLGKQAHRNTHH